MRAFAIVFALAVLPGVASLVQPDQQRSRMESEVAAVIQSFRGQMGVAAVNLKSGETIAVGAVARFATASTI